MRNKNIELGIYEINIFSFKISEAHINEIKNICFFSSGSLFISLSHLSIEGSLKILRSSLSPSKKPTVVFRLSANLRTAFTTGLTSSRSNLPSLE